MKNKILLFIFLLFGLCTFNEVKPQKVDFNIHNKLTLKEYTGGDLYFSSLEVKYDGLPHSLIASCPISWIVSYDKENTYIEVGEYEIIATFKDLTLTYEDVTKTATLKIIEEDKGNITSIILCSTLIPIGLTGLGVGTYFLINYLNKKKYTKPL